MPFDPRGKRRRGVSRAAGATVQVFRDITVMPTQGLRNGMGKSGSRLSTGIFRGGPIWPFFPLQVRARHCRGRFPIPCDVKPALTQAPRRVVADGVWCGPASPHFGHMIADFGMRIAEAAHRTADIPLVFSAGPAGSHPEPRAFFHAILRHLGVPDERVMLIREPTLFRTLRVPAQAERIDGPGPSAAHLDLMDAVIGRRGPVRQDIDLLFVSRSRFVDGRMVAEAYLDAVLAKAGATVIRPETLDLASQIDCYRRARRIVFSEGSALHSLQLLGRLDADVAILVRRPGTRLARAALAPRLRSLAYWDLTEHLIHGRDRNGRRQLDRAVSVIDVPRLLDRFRAFGTDLGPLWDERAYRRRFEADLRRWVANMRARDLHPRAAATIQSCLKAAGIDLSVEEIWSMPAEAPAAAPRKA